MEILNWKLLSHPFNWLIIILMVFIALTALHLIMQPKTANGESQ